MVYSSTKVSHRNALPEAVRSATKSYVHTSFLNNAGLFAQLFWLLPRLGPSLSGLRRRTGRCRFDSRHKRRTRLRFTVQPWRSSTAWMGR